MTRTARPVGGGGGPGHLSRHMMIARHRARVANSAIPGFSGALDARHQHTSAVRTERPMRGDSLMFSTPSNGLRPVMANRHVQPPFDRWFSRARRCTRGSRTRVFGNHRAIRKASSRTRPVGPIFGTRFAPGTPPVRSLATDFQEVVGVIWRPKALRIGTKSLAFWNRCSDCGTPSDLRGDGSARSSKMRI